MPLNFVCMSALDDNKGPVSYRKPTSNPYTPFIYSLVLALGVMLGFVINSVTIGKQPLLQRSYNKLEDVLNYVEMKYVDTIDRKELSDKAIDQLLSNLDPHSVYIPATDVGEVNESLEGNFEGIGIEFSVVEDTITVVTVIPGGPSEMVGMKSGDRIVMIGDTVVAGVKIKDTDVKKKLRGPKGTTVKVTVLRAGRDKPLEFDIQRDKIPLYSVDAAYMINDVTGYIKISNFSSTTHSEFAGKIQALEKQGMKKLMIDLRGNPGGYLQAATQIADELLGGEKLIVYTKGKAYDRQDYNAGKPGLFEAGDVTVLVDQYSASASEILAGAIQDWDRGTIVGRTSFGKGLVQEQYMLRDGSVIRLTVARYYTPSGRCIQRPYTDGKEEYENDLYERYLRGEYFHEDTSATADTTVYKTAKGRIVFGGGGIRPDVFVPLDSSADNDYVYALRTYVPDFIYKYTSQHPGLLDSYKDVKQFRKEFVVTPDMLSAYYTHALAAGLKQDKAKDAKAEPKLKMFLEAFMAKQQWRLEGYYYIVNENDNVVKKALERQYAQ